MKEYQVRPDKRYIKTDCDLVDLSNTVLIVV